MENDRPSRVKERLSREDLPEQLLHQYVSAAEDAENDFDFRHWQTREINRRIQRLDEFESIPDRAAFEQYRSDVLLKRLCNAGVPADLRTMTFDQVRPRPKTKHFDVALESCRDFADHLHDNLEAGQGITLCGPPGVGKSLLASLVVRTALLAGTSCLFVRTRSMLDRLKDWDNASEFREDLESVALLVIDDLGAEYGSDWSRAEIDAIVSTRHAEARSTVTTSNLNLEGLARAYSPRVLDRLRERNGAFQLSGESYRRLS